MVVMVVDLVNISKLTLKIGRMARIRRPVSVAKKLTMSNEICAQRLKTKF